MAKQLLGNLKELFSPFFALKDHAHGLITKDGIISGQASKNVVTDSNGKITTEAKPTIPSANATATNIKMNGTQSAGSLTTFAKADHVHPVDTSRAAASHTHSNYLTEHQDISGKENTSNKVTSISSSSTDTQYPSAKAVYTGLNGKANSSHTHDDRYYTETEVNTKLSDYLTTDDASATYQPKGSYLTSHNPIDTALSSSSTNAVQNKVINTALSGKANSSHTHTKSQITDFPTIPSKTSQLTNDSGYLTEHQSLTNYVQTSDSRLSDTRNPKSNKITASSSNVQDLNTYITTGFYYNSLNTEAQYIIHCPNSNGTATPYSANKAFFLLVEDWGSNNYTKQTLTYYDTNKTYTRIRNGGTWGSWTELTKDTNTTYSADNSTLQLSSTTFSVKDGGITNAKLADKSSLITEYIVGTHGTTATPTWTGTSTKITSLQAGQVIFFKMTSAGTSAGDTLNLTLADGSTTGAKNVYYNATTRLTTHFPVNTILELVYDGTNWLCTAIQNTNNTDRIYAVTQIVNGESSEVPAYTLVWGKTDKKYYKIVSGGIYNIRYPIVWLGAKVSSGAASNNAYILYSSLNLQNTISGKTITTNQAVYVEGTAFSNGNFTVSSNVFVSEDGLTSGRYYVPIGFSHSTTNIRLNTTNQQVYYYDGTNLKPVEDLKYQAAGSYASSSHNHSGTYVDGVTDKNSTDGSALAEIKANSTVKGTIYHPKVNSSALTGVPTGNQSPSFGGTFTVSQPSVNTDGHTTALTSRTITIPSTTASTTANGLMSSDDKTKLDGVATGANAYTHPSYTARTGVPTGNATLSHGGTFTVTQPVCDATGHITALNTRTYTLPSDNNTTYSAGTGMSLNGTTFNHSNSVTAQTSSVFKKIKYDAQGHITGTDNVSASDLPSHTHSDYNKATYSQTVASNASGAYEIGKITIDGTATTIYGKDTNTTYSAATQSANGLMTSGDKQKVDKSMTVGFATLAGTTSAYTASITGVTLTHGTIIACYNAVGANAANATLNVNSLGAKPIYYNASAIPASRFPNKSTALLMYNTSIVSTGCWQMIYSYDSNNTYTAASETPLSDTANGTVGTSGKYARADHTHPKSSLYAEASHTHGWVDKSSSLTSSSAYTHSFYVNEDIGLAELTYIRETWNISQGSSSTSTIGIPSQYRPTKMIVKYVKQDIRLYINTDGNLVAQNDNATSTRYASGNHVFLYRYG